MSVALGFDFGRQRVGVAIGNRLTGTTRALQALSCPRDEQGWQAFSVLMKQWQPQQLVLGFPSDERSPKALRRAIRQFATELNNRFQLPVTMIDESYSSRTAAETLREARADGRKTRRNRPGEEDSLAAADILAQWLATDG